jgi:hypothetical protein
MWTDRHPSWICFKSELNSTFTHRSVVTTGILPPTIKVFFSDILNRRKTCLACTTHTRQVIFHRLLHYAFRAQWLLYLPTGSTLKNSIFCPHHVFTYFVWTSEQTAIISLYSINWLVFITETESVYCAVRSAHTVYLCVLYGSENKQRLFHCTALTDWFL